MKNCYTHGHDPVDTGMRLSWCRRCDCKLRWHGDSMLWEVVKPETLEESRETENANWPPWAGFPVSGEGKLERGGTNAD